MNTSGLTNNPTGENSAPEAILCSSSNQAYEPGSSPTSAEVPPSVLSENPAAEVESSSDETVASPAADSWRDELAARLERYRTRRKPRSPRYPSLLLPFDAPESWTRSTPSASSNLGSNNLGSTNLGSTNLGSNALATAPASDEHHFEDEHRFEEDRQLLGRSTAEAPEEVRYTRADPAPEPSAKVIEFPRSAAIPIFHANALADPIFDRPRIVEAPEILPPPPALGGILIESVQQEAADRRPESPYASPSASIARRGLAALVDGAIVAASSAIFAAIFFRLNLSFVPNLQNLRGSLFLPAVGLIVVAVVLWVAYEFSFVVYTGSTLGLRAVGLQLATFDGAPLTRSLRRWRVLASFLSALSMGLGYLWCALDQDGLCWHDRITRTHVEAAPPKAKLKDSRR
jgi:uncharacterized RDD family membrane protein YckC